MLKISIHSIKDILSPRILVAIFIGLALVSFLYYYIFIYKTPEECIANEIIKHYERKSMHETAVKLKKVEAKRMVSVWYAEAEYYKIKNSDTEMGEYRRYGEVLEYCNIDIEK